MATRTTCPYCGVGCGLLASRDGDGRVTVKGDPDHPANFGRLCTKGSALGETTGLEGRLLSPQINYREASWEEAISRVATAFSDAIRDHGPDSVAIYGSGQLLTEDYYVANKFMKGFVGSANIDTNSRLCMASTVAGHKRAFGSDTVPGTYEDLEKADLVVLVGSNLAWCHPVLYQRLAAAKAERPHMRVVNIDPRRTATSDLADQHLAIAPGSDVALFNGLLAAIEASGAVDAEYVAAHVDGLSEALQDARSDAAHVAETTGVSAAEINSFYNSWIKTERVVTVFSQGVNQSTAGVDKVNSIINCHLATGRIGRVGMGPFSVTGQPNAMGGREVGGLSNMLACHLALENETHRDAVQAHWEAPKIATRPGLKAVDLFQACADGQIKALWIMSTNPAVSMPEADVVRKAISATPFVAVSDMFGDTDTAKLADVLLPAAGWGEKSGTVTNSDRTISRQRAFMPPPGEARPDWRIICDVAKAMGWADEFAYEKPSEIFREHAALSGLAAGFGADFDASGLAGLSDTDYDTLAPRRWPIKTGSPNERFFAKGGFFTPNKRGQVISVKHRGLAVPSLPDGSLRLNTGRVRDHWHTMTRTARSPRLNRHIAEPYVEINPADAARLDLRPAYLARIKGEQGEAIARVLVTDRVREGDAFMPMHWTAAFSSAGRVGPLIAPAVDPISGQPELKGGVCTVEPFAAKWYGFVIARGETPAPLPTDFWAIAPTSNGWRAEIASLSEARDLKELASELFGSGGDLITVTDKAHGASRVASIRDGTVEGVIFRSAIPVAVDRQMASEALSTGASVGDVLAGVPSVDRPDPGSVVCSCFAVGVNTVSSAVAEHKVFSLERLGELTLAGTGCGTCRPELKTILDGSRIAVHGIGME